LGKGTQTVGTEGGEYNGKGRIHVKGTETSAIAQAAIEGGRNKKLPTKRLEHRSGGTWGVENRRKGRISGERLVRK